MAPFGRRIGHAIQVFFQLTFFALSHGPLSDSDLIWAFVSVLLCSGFCGLGHPIVLGQNKVPNDFSSCDHKVIRCSHQHKNAQDPGHMSQNVQDLSFQNVNVSCSAPLSLTDSEASGTRFQCCKKRERSQMSVMLHMLHLLQWVSSGPKLQSQRCSLNRSKQAKSLPSICLSLMHETNRPFQLLQQPRIDRTRWMHPHGLH